MSTKSQRKAKCSGAHCVFLAIVLVYIFSNIPAYWFLRATHRINSAYDQTASAFEFAYAPVFWIIEHVPDKAKDQMLRPIDEMIESTTD